jgi:predicted CoA-binding protein
VSDESRTVVVLGASPKPERHSNQAVRRLLEHGYRVVPVRPAVETIEGLKVLHALGEVTEPVHTLTLYVSKAVSAKLEEEIVALDPGRVIFNPGAENPELREALEARGIQTIEGCTLVMLGTGQF